MQRHLLAFYKVAKQRDNAPLKQKHFDHLKKGQALAAQATKPSTILIGTYKLLKFSWSSWSGVLLAGPMHDNDNVPATQHNCHTPDMKPWFREGGGVVVYLFNTRVRHLLPSSIDTCQNKVSADQ